MVDCGLPWDGTGAYFTGGDIPGIPDRQGRRVEEEKREGGRREEKAEGLQAVVTQYEEKSHPSAKREVKGQKGSMRPKVCIYSYQIQC